MIKKFHDISTWDPSDGNNDPDAPTDEAMTLFKDKDNDTVYEIELDGG